MIQSGADYSKNSFTDPKDTCQGGLASSQYQHIFGGFSGSTSCLQKPLGRKWKAVGVNIVLPLATVDSCTFFNSEMS